MQFWTDSWRTIDNPAINSISEMGGSMKTVAYSLQLVPSVRQYDYGRSYIYALLTIFPNLFWKVHPTMSHGQLSDWLIREVDPYVASRGGGLGFSFIAEAYVNFGWIGGALQLALLGFLLSRLMVRVDKTSQPHELAAVACVLAFLLLYVRNEAATITRGLVWYALAPYLLVCILGRSQRIRTEWSRFAKHRVIRTRVLLKA
jgi:oligosaccharide repeat unit polymerase